MFSDPDDKGRKGPRSHPLYSTSRTARRRRCNAPSARRVPFRRLFFFREGELAENADAHRARLLAAALPPVARPFVFRLLDVRVEGALGDHDVQVGVAHLAEARLAFGVVVHPLEKGRRRREAAFDLQFLGHELVLVARLLGRLEQRVGDRRRALLVHETQLVDRLGQPHAAHRFGDEVELPRRVPDVLLDVPRRRHADEPLDGIMRRPRRRADGEACILASSGCQWPSRTPREDPRSRHRRWRRRLW
mmetsp:Transcript_20979/g.83631  ORF Transcript_20979/g.83631 Transcript_20979/m.83631 type:complete len:248 (-) Transcript_20979:29-772(-)